MTYATRLNSFLSNGYDMASAFAAIAAVRPGAMVDLNYPEHFVDVGVDGVKSLLDAHGLSVNGLAVRYRESYISGEFSTLENYDRAIKQARETVDTLAKLDGSVITLWLSYDGNDYSFQDDYSASWQHIVRAFTVIADYAAPRRLSIEFKPYEPRSFSLMPSSGFSLYLLQRVNRENIGLTLDFCHMLMARENPALGLALTLHEEKLFGVHLNDGYGQIDDGLMFGSVNPARATEFVYYLKKGNYPGPVYFDTFPVREDPAVEFATNVETYERISKKIDLFGMEEIERVIRTRDGIESQRMMQRLFYEAQ